MQTVYTMYQDAGLAGLIYDLSAHDTYSLSAEGPVTIGGPVTLGTNKERQCKTPTTGAGQGALVIGVSILQYDFEQAGNTPAVAYADKETVSVMKKGRIWVNVNDAVTAGNVANLHLATGKFTDDAVAAGIEAFTQIAAKFLTSTTGAGLAVLEFQQK